ncbi:sulfur carrier protein ThiS [Atlantibacter hermannii]|uniref:sulfur carrier protein ThiS n=1 Tax=Atlantibacter hermannii TaxID=565 RepID=UPI0022B7891F|nr:sulfur carrier protein ThiS [Atlantibacter hermannii]MCZ7836918.1 sulfur carrier protein ThiS [Atlantibacter hermannii]
MRIALNDQQTDCAEAITLHGLLEQQGLLKPGIALAVNDAIVPRSQWPEHVLQDSDSVLLFQVIAGG